MTSVMKLMKQVANSAQIHHAYSVQSTTFVQTEASYWSQGLRVRTVHATRLSLGTVLNL